MQAHRTVRATMTVCVLLAGSVQAQWQNYPTPGIPRLPDGKPDLAAPAPRLADGHPDVSGIWDVGNMLYFHDLATGLKPGDVQTTPWAAAIRKQRIDAESRRRSVRLLPAARACRASTFAARSRSSRRRR